MHVRTAKPKTTKTRILSLLVFLVLPVAIDAAVPASDPDVVVRPIGHIETLLLASVSERWCRLSLYGCYPGRRCPGHEERRWCDQGLWWESFHGGRRGPSRLV